MAPLAPNATPRFRCHYTSAGEGHTMQLRSGASPSYIGGVFNDIFTAMDPAMAPATLDFVDWAPAGSDIFNPVVTGQEGNAYTGAVFTDEMKAWAYTFLGRSTGGRRVRLFLFSALFLGSDYRIEASASAPIAAAIAALTAAGSNVLCIDGLTPVWKSYVDIQVNDHWVKVLRP